MWIEKGMGDNTVGDSYGESSPENLLEFLKIKLIIKLRGNTWNKIKLEQKIYMTEKII